MLTKVVNPYLEDLALVHDLLFLGRHISEIEELGAEDLHPQGRVHLQSVKGLLVPLHADYGWVVSGCLVTYFLSFSLFF
jgi:hypothetical protein